MESTGAGVSALRATLQIPFGISLVLLLHTASLSRKNGYDWSQLINTWVALGNNKPPLLLEIEQMILREVLATSAGLQSPMEALDTLHTELPWKEIDKVNELDDSWFDLGK